MRWEQMYQVYIVYSPPFVLIGRKGNCDCVTEEFPIGETNSKELSANDNWDFQLKIVSECWVIELNPT